MAHHRTDRTHGAHIAAGVDAADAAGLRSRFVREATAGLFGDLIRDAFRFRPLPPIAELPFPLRAQQSLPAVVRGALRWTPHAGLVLLTALLVRLQSQSEVIARDKLGGEILVAVTLLLTLCWPVLASWLLVLAAAVSLFHPGGLVGPFPFADVRMWPDLLYDIQGRPWAMAGLLACTAVLVISALRLPLRAVVWLWVLTVTLAAVGNGPFSVGALTMALFSGLMPLIGVIVTGRREARAEAAVRASAAEDERARRTLLEERAVIARELHDVVAHHMSVIAIQAEAAPYRVPEPPPELERAFGTVRESAVAALAELRRVLGVVRTEPASPATPDEVEAPQPTLDDLDSLLAGVRAVGVPAESVVTGEVRGLPRGVELSAYRIVQEGLSNALRHAPKAAVRVELSYATDGLGLLVVNAPPAHPARPSPGAGHGLTGMRERVAMLGGRLSVGATDEGGFEVRGFLPSQRGGAAVDAGDTGGRGGADD